MLTNHLLSNILEASEKRNAKVVFLGNSNQLLPIGAGNAFARMTRKNNEQVPTFVWGKSIGKNKVLS